MAGKRPDSGCFANDSQGWLVETQQWLFGGEDAVGYGGGFDCGADVVGADDVGAGEDGGYIGSGGGVEAILHRGGAAIEKN